MVIILDLKKLFDVIFLKAVDSSKEGWIENGAWLFVFKFDYGLFHKGLKKGE